MNSLEDAYVNIGMKEEMNLDVFEQYDQNKFLDVGTNY